MSSERAINIREATSRADSDFVISCFDKALPWLASIGSEGQWGTQSFFEKTNFCTETTGYVEGARDLSKGIAWIADVKIGDEGTPAGAIVLGTTATSYAPAQSVSPPVNEIYVLVLITDRTLGVASKGVGSVLLDFAKTVVKKEGVGLMRVDCWRGGDDSLVRYVLPLQLYVRGLTMIIRYYYTRVKDSHVQALLHIPTNTFRVRIGVAGC